MNSAAQETATPAPDDGWEWACVEIYGHRSHWGRTREEERFGTKMLRIDVPTVKWSETTPPEPVATGWVTHFYGGSAIFSCTPTDEATALRRNAGFRPAQRYSLPPPGQENDEQDMEF